MTTITISDAGTWSKYELDGAICTMTKSGGCPDLLKKAPLSEDMSDKALRAEVLEAWAAKYDGDADNIRVEIERAS